MADTQTSGQTNSQISGHTNIRTDIQLDLRTHKHPDRQFGNGTKIHDLYWTHKETDRQKDGQTEALNPDTQTN